MVAEYELFYYFYRNYFLFRRFNSVTNNTNSSYDNSDRIQNLIDRVGSMNILQLKHTKRKDSKIKAFPMRRSLGPNRLPPFFQR